MISIKALFSVLPLVAVINGHMIMKTPIPYGKGSISNAPLDPSGSDFPCKGIFNLANGDADINRMAVGSTQTLSFTGSAVHGGGSCQVSLTKDLKPTKDSKWMVIKSIEGSCPAGVAGNLPADPNGSGASTFQYTIPQGISPGEYTIAWTWVNKIGNREFYMNCGRADISAAAKKRYAPNKPVEKRQSSFPDMFVANLASVNSCKTTEGIDIKYPNPGQDPIVSTNPDVKFGPPVGDCGATGSSSSSSGSSSSGSSGSSGSGSGSAASSAAAAPAATSAGSAPGVFASGAAAAPAATTTAAAAGGSGPAAPTTAPALPSVSTAAPSVPAAAPSAVPSAAPAPAPAQPAAGGAGGQSPGAACSPEGQWLCAADGQSFQRCASGRWSASMAVAAGTSCAPGMNASISMTAGKASPKRRSFTA